MAKKDDINLPPITLEVEKNGLVSCSGIYQLLEIFNKSGLKEELRKATNTDLTHKNLQSVIESYRPRADAENMIKEFKINFDAKHLPCLSFSANEVYFLFVLIAQNLIRWVALLGEPNKPGFTKKIRDQFIFAPGRVLKGSRKFTKKNLSHTAPKNERV